MIGLALCGVLFEVWCGVFGVVWRGVPWCGLSWCGLVCGFKCSAARSFLDSLGVIRQGVGSVVWCVAVQCGLCGLEWCCVMCSELVSGGVI